MLRHSRAHRNFFLPFGYVVVHVKTPQIREKKMGVYPLDRSTRGLEDLTNFTEMLFFASICLLYARFKVDIRYILDKEIFEPIPIFFNQMNKEIQKTGDGKS